jgi:hypothetical protein
LKEFANSIVRSKRADETIHFHRNEGQTSEQKTETDLIDEGDGEKVVSDACGETRWVTKGKKGEEIAGQSNEKNKTEEQDQEEIKGMNSSRSKIRVEQLIEIE